MSVMNGTTGEFIVRIGVTVDRCREVDAATGAPVLNLKPGFRP